MKNLLLIASVFMICLLSGPSLFACGSTTVTGPVACGTATVNFGVPAVTYTATTTTSSSACTVFEWRITGGTANGFTSVNLYETLGCMQEHCPFNNEGILCMPNTILGNDAASSSLAIVWTPGAPIRRIEVTVKELGDLGPLNPKSKGELLIDEVITPESITRVTRTCGGGSYRINLPRNTDCGPDSFNWFLNGNFIGSTTTNTRTIPISNLQSSYSVGGQGVYDGRASAVTTQSFPALVQNGVIIGPSLICEGSDNQFNISTYPGVTPSSVQWQSSSNQITIGSPNSTSTAVFVGGSPPSSFQLSCTTVTCGITKVNIRTISIGTPGEGNCPPIPRGDGVSSLIMEEIDQAQGTELSTLMRAEEKEVEVETNAALANTKQVETTVFPNPVKLGGSVFLLLDCMQTESTQIEILDGMGKRVFTEERSDVFQLELSTSQIKSPGNYVLRVNNDCGSKIYKLLVVK